MESKTALADVRKSLIAPRPAEPPRWSYKNNRPDWAYTLQGVTYDYQLIHKRSESVAPLEVVQLGDIFDLDHAIEEITGTKYYKQNMWKELRTKEPAFISTITRDDLVVRVCSWNEDTGTVVVQPAHYSDQVVLCQA